MKLVLAALTLLLCGVLALQWWSWAPGDALPGPPSASSSPSGPADERADAMPPDLALELPPREDYASVVERPLFLPERRPPPDEEPEPETEVPELTELDGVDLTAVVITPEVVSAWVRAPDNQELKRLRLGDEFLGWTVKTIEPQELVLQRQGDTNRLLLRDYENAPQPIPPTRLPPQRQARGTDAGPPGGDADRRRAGTQDAAGDDGAVGGTAADRRSPGQDAVRAPSRRQPSNRSTPTRQPPRRPPTAAQ